MLFRDGFLPHLFTKGYKAPEKTPHKTMIALCEVLNMPPYELIIGYKVGISRISEIEKDYNKKRYHALSKS